MINILVCDDEKSSVEENKKHLEQFLESTGQEYNILCYMNGMVEEHVLKNIDIAILDIDFRNEETTGIELAQRAQTLNKWVAVIFVTCHSEYALDAFRLQVFGYLEKPVNLVHMDIILKKVLVYVRGIKNNLETAVLEFMYNRKKVVIRQKNIAFIEKVNRKLKIETRQCDYEINDSISAIEDELTSFFVKINSGTLINMYFITEIEKYNVYLSNGHSFHISRDRLNEVKEKYFLFTNNK